ncbi:MAG TPA: hypothetical protein VL860_05675 [Planctomycetota bacterium]|nr:hypothetical protein [Planctomycetota bacterium]
MRLPFECPCTTLRPRLRRPGCTAARLLTLTALACGPVAALIAGEDLTPAAPANPPPVAAAAEISPAAKAMAERLRQVRPNLGDEDVPTRDKALDSIRSEMAAQFEALFRVPPEEDTADQRRMLKLIANEMAAKIDYEENLLLIPAAKRTAVDAMLKAQSNYQTYFSASTEDRIKFIEALCAAKPDVDTLAAFLCTQMMDKDAPLATAVLEHAAAAPSPAYLATAEDLLKKGFAELYLPKEANANQMQMMMYTRTLMGDFNNWYAALQKLIAAIPGPAADKLLLTMFESLSNPMQNQTMILQVNRGSVNQLVIELANTLVKRGIQSAFPTLVKGAEGHSLMESGMRINNNPIQYSSAADLLIYTAYRIIDPKVPEQTTGQNNTIAWKSSADRLKFYDDFLAAWQAEVQAKRPHREGLEEYQQWYEPNRRQMAQVLELERKQHATSKNNGKDNNGE